MHTHLFRAALAAVWQLAVPAATMARAQSFQADRASDAGYQVSTIYDRLTDSTRVAVALKESSRRFGLDSRVWLGVSFTHAGRRLTVPPEAVVLTLESFTSARGGLAFAHPQKLRVQSGRIVKLEVPAGEYEKLGFGLLDSGRHEMLSFRFPTEQFVAMAAEPELELKAGNARMRLRERGMGMLRDVVRRLTPSNDGVR